MTHDDTPLTHTGKAAAGFLSNLIGTVKENREMASPVLSACLERIDNLRDWIDAQREEHGDQIPVNPEFISLLVEAIGGVTVVAAMESEGIVRPKEIHQ